MEQNKSEKSEDVDEKQVQKIDWKMEGWKENGSEMLCKYYKNKLEG